MGKEGTNIVTTVKHKVNALESDRWSKNQLNCICKHNLDKSFWLISILTRWKQFSPIEQRANFLSLFTSKPIDLMET